MSEHITYLTSENFEDVIEGAPAAVIDFYADWCGPCQAMLPIFDKLAEAYEGKIVFCKVDTDGQKRLAIQNRVMSIPCFMFYKDGTMTERHDGLLSEDDLKAKLDALL